MTNHEKIYTDIVASFTPLFSARNLLVNSNGNKEMFEKKYSRSLSLFLPLFLSLSLYIFLSHSTCLINYLTCPEEAMKIKGLRYIRVFPCSICVPVYVAFLLLGNSERVLEIRFVLLN